MAESFPAFATIDFSTMTTPTLVVAGDQDASAHLTAAGPDWHADHTTLFPEDPAWNVACDALAAEPNPQGRVDSKSNRMIASRNGRMNRKILCGRLTPREADEASLPPSLGCPLAGTLASSAERGGFEPPVDA